MNFFRLLILTSIFCSLSLSAPAQPAKPGAESELTELQIPSGDINLILDTYEKMSGKTIIRDANIAAGTNIRIVAPGPIPKAQALRLLESVLMLNGYALVLAEDNSAKVVNAVGGKNPRSEGLPVYANLADLPKGDQVVTYFMQFQYISSQDAAPIFQAQVPPHPWGVFVPVPHAQALVITENASTIRQMARLKELIDVPPAKIISRFVTLDRADAERVATLITKLIEDRKNKSQNAGSGSTPNTLPPGSPESPVTPSSSSTPDLNERNLVAGEVQLVPDPRTNRILVVTRPVNFEYINSLIKEFDQAVNLTAPLDRPLKYVTASEVLPVLETLLAENKDDSQSVGRTTQNQNQTPSSTSGSDGSQDTINKDKTLQENQNTAPLAVMVGKTRLIADNQANSIIVIGPPESLDKVRAILDALDKKPMQVYLSTVIGQLTLTDSSELAIDILHKYSKHGNFGIAGLIKGRSEPVVEPSDLASVASFASLPAGLTIYGAIGSALDYYVKALASTNRFKLISRPVIYTMNNKGALIASGQKIAVPTSSLTSLNNGELDSGSVVSNIDYTDVELRLEVIPQINSNREVTLKIKQTNDSVVGATVISGNSIPTIGTQVVDTTITVPNKSTIVLGGLIMEDNNTSVSGVPYLKDIPVLGYLFKGTTKTKNRTELIILIQPIVIGSDEELAEASQVEVDRTKFGPESKAFSENTPYIPPGKNQNPSPKKTPRGLTPSKNSPPAPTPLPLETPGSPDLIP